MRCLRYHNPCYVPLSEPAIFDRRQALPSAQMRNCDSFSVEDPAVNSSSIDRLQQILRLSTGCSQRKFVQLKHHES